LALAVESGYLWAVTDSAGRIAIGVQPDGTAYIAKLNLANNSVSAVKLDADTQSRLVSSGLGATYTALGPETASTWSFGITDNLGRMAVGISPSGQVTIPKLILGNGVVDVPNLAAALAARVPQELPVESGYIWAVPDSAGRVALGIRPDGTLVAAKTSFPTYTRRVSENATYLSTPFIDSANRYQVRVSRRSDGQVTLLTTGTYNTVEPVLTEDDRLLYSDDHTGTLTGYWRAADGTGIAGLPLLPLSGVDQYGDSLTESGYVGMTVPLAAALGQPVTNYGMGGQGSNSIAARFGSLPVTVRLSGASIPADPAAVSVTAISVGLLAAAGTGTRSIHGTILGVPGTLAQTGGSAGPITFTRDTSGAVTAVPNDTPFLVDYQPLRSLLIWTGRNDAVNIPANYDNTKAQIAGMVARARAFVYQPRFFILGLITGAGEGNGNALHDAMVLLNNELAGIYGGAFLDIRRYLIDHGLADAGITPTGQDTADIAVDTIPTSLRAVGDTIHLNDAAYGAIVTHLLVPAFQAKGWL
jgi:hypothetical protein